MRRQAGWWLAVLIAFGIAACGSSTEIPTVAEDPWATPEEDEPEPDAGHDAGPDISTFAPCGNGGMCNPNNLGGETCLGLGMGEGILACDAVTCTYDTSMCEGTMGNGGSGSVGVGNGNGNTGGNGSQPAFGSNPGAEPMNDGNTPQLFGGDFFGGNADGGVGLFGGNFFGGNFFGGGENSGDDEADDREPVRNQDPMDGGVGLDAGL